MKYASRNKVMLWVLLCIAAISSMIAYVEINKSTNAKIIFLDVGQGDATLIITPKGRQILIDAGKYPNISEKISHYMPSSDRTIEMIIATHPDIDHVLGFNTLLDEYVIEYFMHSGLLAGASAYKSIADKVRNKNIPNHSVVAGERIYIDKDMYLEILSPYPYQRVDDPNEISIVTRLVYQGKGIILTGDAPKIVEQNITNMYGGYVQSDILKVGHHGSKTSTDDGFVKMVDPHYAIISAACDNSYGHPHASVLQTLIENKVQNISTCEYGDIVFNFEEGDWVLINKK